MDPVNPTLNDLQQRFEILSPATRIGMSIRSVVADGSVNPDEILSLILLEPLLATRILREANLMVDKRPEGYISIEEAATALGFQRMYDLLGLYSYPGNSDSHSYSSKLWKRAITSAICMENLAKRHNLDKQRAYAIGLVHSLADAIVDSEQESYSTDDAENALGNRLKDFNNAEICSSLLSDWGLPIAFVDPIRFQYNPLECQTTGKMACLLNLAKWITGVVREVEELPDQALGPDLLVLNLLGEGERSLWNLISDVSERLLQADAVIEGKFTNC